MNITIKELEALLAAAVAHRVPNVDLKITHFDQPSTLEDGGEVTIKFNRKFAPVRPTIPQTISRAQDEPCSDDKVLVVAALRDAAEKNKFPFISLSWFVNTYAPAVIPTLGSLEIKRIVSQAIATGDIILEKLTKPDRPDREVTAIRTPDMAPAQNPPNPFAVGE